MRIAEVDPSATEEFLGLRSELDELAHHVEKVVVIGTLGYVAISAKDNPQLEETTDREGFKTSVGPWESISFRTRSRWTPRRLPGKWFLQFWARWQS